MITIKIKQKLDFTGVDQLTLAWWQLNGNDHASYTLGKNKSFFSSWINSKTGHE